MTLTFVWRSFKVTSTTASHSPLNISETVRDRGLVPKDDYRKRHKESNGHVTVDWWRHVTLKGQVVTPICLKPVSRKQLEMLFINNRWLLD